jgi:hypothetical protein
LSPPIIAETEEDKPPQEGEPPVTSVNFTVTPLTNGTTALSWPVEASPATYRLYSDMGSGFDVFLYKSQTTRPAYVDKYLKPGATYNYRVTAISNGKERFLAQKAVTTIEESPRLTEEDTATGFEVTTVGVVTALPTALPPDAVLLGLVSDNRFTDEFNKLTIVGEVRNDSNLIVGDTEITVTFYDANGSVITTTAGTSMLATIPPGEKSPFIISMERPAGLDSHSLRAIARPVEPAPYPQLTVTELRRFEDDAGFFHIKGTIRNAGSTAARQVTVAAAIYDRSNRVINISFAYTDPPVIPPGAEAAYDVTFAYYPRYYTQRVIAIAE